jgi:predicted Zn-dependent protease with MMP-like domain
MPDNISLEEMLHHLLEMDDDTWGQYAFTREILNKRIQPDQKLEMIAKANACGKEYAHMIMQETESKDISTIADQLKLKIEFHETSMIGKRVLFARYTPPAQIEIMKEPILRAVAKLSEDTILVEHFQQNDIIDIILGHEIFHFVEEEHIHRIYTRTEKILLWKFMGFENRSVIRTLGEIGAMAFVKELMGLNFSPFILDVLLYYCYDPASAEKIYQDVLANQVRKVQKTIEDYKQ